MSRWGRLGAGVCALLCAAPVLADSPPEQAGDEPHIRYGSDQTPAQFQIGAALRASVLALQPFTTDAQGTQLQADPFETRLRLDPQVRYRAFSLVNELDVLGGALVGTPAASEYLDSPHPRYQPINLRKLYVEYRAPTWIFRLGQQTSSWGLGMLANDGARDPAPGEGFGDAHFGDLVYRALLAGRPLFGLGGAWRAIEPAAGIDVVARDETADFSQGDRAVQGIFALRFAVDDNHWFGLYTVYRHQRNTSDSTLGYDAFVGDLAGKWQWPEAVWGGQLNLGAEAAYIGGSATLARSEAAPVQQISQLGAALKSSLRFQRWEYYLDLGYASGDSNPYADQLTAFHFNPDYNESLILFKEVLGWQSARAAALASNPSLVGQPPAGVSLLPTRGGIYNAAYVFPKVRRAIGGWLDLYGGPLFAIATSKLADPYATSAVGGGAPTNSLGGSPGSYLGTELDLGAQAHWKIAQTVPVTVAAEAGYFIPGDAFNDARGITMAPVAAGRARLSIPF